MRVLYKIEYSELNFYLALFFNSVSSIKDSSEGLNSGVPGRSRTDDFTVLQTVALDLSATDTIII